MLFLNKYSYSLDFQWSSEDRSFSGARWQFPWGVRGKGVSISGVKCLPIAQCLLWVSSECNQRWWSSRGKEFAVYLPLGLKDHLIPSLSTSLHCWEVLEMWKPKEKDEDLWSMYHFISQVGEGKMLFSVHGWESNTAPLYPIGHSSPFPRALYSVFFGRLRRSLWLD